MNAVVNLVRRPGDGFVPFAPRTPGAVQKVVGPRKVG